MQRFLLITEKSHCVSILGPIGTQILKARFFQKKLLWSILSLYAAASSCETKVPGTVFPQN